MEYQVGSASPLVIRDRVPEKVRGRLTLKAEGQAVSITEPVPVVRSATEEGTAARPLSVQVSKNGQRKATRIERARALRDKEDRKGPCFVCNGADDNEPRTITLIEAPGIEDVFPVHIRCYPSVGAAIARRTRKGKSGQRGVG